MQEIFSAAGVEPAGVVPWETRPSAPAKGRATGIYIVALTDDLDRLEPAADAPLSDARLDELLTARPELSLDGRPATRSEVAARLAAFWLPDEVVLYIGLAGTRRQAAADGELAGRVGAYYATRIGARSPHAGGWPLKMLANLDCLWVHYGYCGEVDAAEAAGLSCFADNVSPATRALLHDAVHVMPYANLEYPKGVRKQHGIRGAKAPRTPSQSPPPAGSATPGSTPNAAVVPSSAVGGGVSAHLPVHRSQPVTANDIAAGQVRIPIGSTKRLLPLERTDIVVRLHDVTLTCRWDPRYGTDRERSGIIRVGRSGASALQTGVVLGVALDGDVVELR